jgi:ATP-dependent Lhr-like helicase
MPPNKQFEHMISELLSLPRGSIEPKFLASVKRVFLSQYYQQMTEIQSTAIPDIFYGNNVVVVAPTASGKTEAAVIPVAARYLSENLHDLCVYIAPTRALLNDIISRVGPSLDRLHLTYAVRHGDIPLTKETNEIGFLFMTLESFDFLFKTAPRLLRRTRWAILDEIHQLYGTARGEQLRMLLRRLELLSGRRIQVVAMSATIANPEALKEWLFQNRESHIHSVTSGRELQVRIHYGRTELKLHSLLDPESVAKLLIFANSRRRCEEIHQTLSNEEPYETYIHYSSLSRAERMAVEREFARKTYAIGVATSTLELGIDIGSIDKVLLADPPATVASFLQRAGRGSRRQPRNLVECLANSAESFLLYLSVASLAIEGTLEPTKVFPIQGVVLQQILSYIASKTRKRFHPSELHELFVKTGEIQSEQLQEILRTLVSAGFLDYDSSWNSYSVGPYLAGIIDLPMIHSNISEVNDGLPVYQGNRRIGTVSLSPNELSEGKVLLLGGRFWKIVRSGNTSIRVLPSQRVDTPLMPRWYSGRRIHISHYIAQRCAEILSGKELPKSLSMDNESRITLERLRASFNGLSVSRRLPYWVTQQSIEYLTFAGDFGNAIMALIISEAGTYCRPVKGREYLLLRSDVPLDFKYIPNDPDQIKPIVQKHWRALSSYAIQSPFSAMLPMQIRREEIVSQLIQREILEFIVSFHRKELIRIRDPFLQPSHMAQQSRRNRGST